MKLRPNRFVLFWEAFHSINLQFFATIKGYNHEEEGTGSLTAGRQMIIIRYQMVTKCDDVSLNYLLIILMLVPYGRKARNRL